MDEAMSTLRSKKNKVQDPDEAFGMTIGASLRSISNIQNKEFAKIKIQEIIIQAQFGNPMAPFAPNHYHFLFNTMKQVKNYKSHKNGLFKPGANTANHLSSWNSNSPQLTKKLV